MRVATIAAILLLSACAGQKLALAPPPGVDFSGHWKLNDADSDDPQHLMQANNAKAANGNDGTSGSGGQDGRQGGRNRSGGAGGPGSAGTAFGRGPYAPAMPAMGAVGEALRWPGKDLVIKQVAGVVAFTSDGINRVCQPSGDGAHRRHAHAHAEDRDALPAGRDAPPPTCGWDDKVLLVRGGDPDDDRPPFEEQYSISEDGQRLVEIVGFKGGKSNGFTMSRVWDKIQP